MSHLNKASLFGIAVIAFITGLYLYWLFIQPDVINFEETNALVVDKKVYYPGDRITYTLEFCKSKKSVAVVDRALVDSFRVTFAQVTSDLPTGCNKINVNDLVIPDFIVGSGDDYYVEITGVYQINPIRKQYVYLRTENFQIK